VAAAAEAAAAALNVRQIPQAFRVLSRRTLRMRSVGYMGGGYGEDATGGGGEGGEEGGGRGLT
jgi:hypothetical protein